MARLWPTAKLATMSGGSFASMTEAGLSSTVCGSSTLDKRENGCEPGALFSDILAAGCRFGGGDFVAGVRVGQTPALDDRRE